MPVCVVLLCTYSACMHYEQGSRDVTSYKGFDGLITHRMLSKGCVALSAFDLSASVLL